LENARFHKTMTHTFLASAKRVGLQPSNENRHHVSDYN